MAGIGSYIWENFDYYAAPEGHDPIGKIVGFGQYGFWTGSFIALYDACLWSHCANAPQFLNTAGYWVVPLTGMCVAFSAVTYSLTNIRKKDDKINYVGGVLAAGGILHAWQKCIRTSAWGTVFMLLYATLKKQAIMDGHERNIVLMKHGVDSQKWLFPWRNLEYRNYSSKPWFPHDKTDYYVNHY